MRRKEFTKDGVKKWNESRKEKRREQQEREGEKYCIVLRKL